MANDKEKHTPESLAAKVVRALLKAPTGKKDGKKDRTISKRLRHSKEQSD
jgi:hypothetical protein